MGLLKNNEQYMKIESDMISKTEKQEASKCYLKTQIYSQ